MLDIIEIALDYLTDDRLFEKLASEIMRDEGYPNITPLGGVRDEGIDAVQDKFYENQGRSRTIFQYTIQEYVQSKIDETIEKLIKNKIDYQELIIVTKRGISTERQNILVDTARKKYGVSLKIYERKTLVNRLSKTENGIFTRLFPDIEKQVSNLKLTRTPYLSGEQASLIEIAMLKSSIAFVFNSDAKKARRSIFDYLTLGLLLAEPSKDLSFEELRTKYSNAVTNIKPAGDQIIASLNRLKVLKLIEQKGNSFRPTMEALKTIEARTIEVNNVTGEFISDIVDEVCRTAEQKISAEDRLKLERNTQELLILFFRLFGIEMANQVLKNKQPGPIYLEAVPSLLDIAKKQISNNLGELLISVISKTLATPTPEQARILTNWSLAYTGLSVMNLDPSLKEFQTTHIAKKAFVLDTDFILDCLVQECPRSKTYLELIKALLNKGSRVIIPKSCLEECIKHAELSPRTYNHFGQQLLSLSEDMVSEMVWNVFVKGYYYGITKGVLAARMTFEKYLQNYYLSKDPTGFIQEAIRVFFPRGVEILDLNCLLSRAIPENEVNALREELRNILIQSKKSEYRTSEMINNLAELDSRLFLTVYYLSEGQSEQTSRLLGNNFYLITSSGRYLRASKNIGIRNTITTRPQALAALLELMGNIDLTDQEYVRLLENPFLKYAIEKSLEDIKILIDSGIELQGVSIPKLRYDLDQGLHNCIIEFSESETQLEAQRDSEPEASDPPFVKLVKSASARGYKMIPELKELVRILEKTQEEADSKAKELEELEAHYKELDQAIKYFGKRKQRYLKRFKRTSRS